jgi:hypothetical protein
MVEHLPGKHKALSLTLGTTKKKKNKIIKLQRKIARKEERNKV